MKLQSQASFLRRGTNCRGRESYDSLPVGPLERLGRIIEMGQRVAKDTTHQQGWDYTGLDQMTVQVYGSYCDQIKQSANQVLIILGCMGKDIIIPRLEKLLIR